VHIPGEVGSVRVSGARYITANPTPSVMMTDSDFDGSFMVGSHAYSSTAQAGFTQPTVNEKGEAIHYGYAVSFIYYVRLLFKIVENCSR
jgi:hypothetical protein